MKKNIFILIISWVLQTGLSAQVSIQVAPQFSLEGRITAKNGNKPLVNEQLSVYAFDQVWLVTTGSNGDYLLDFSKNGKNASPPQGMDGKNKIIFFYTDKRKCIVPTNNIKFNPNGANAPPVVHWDVKL
jgi:hypothetical protein